MAPAARLDGIDFLKAAAITAVVFAHSGVYLFSPRATPWDRWLTGGWVWLGEAAWRLATGSALGVYYFVPLLAACELLIWPLSRLRAPGVAGVVGLCLAYALASALAPRWRTASSASRGQPSAASQPSTK